MPRALQNPDRPKRPTPKPGILDIAPYVAGKPGKPTARIAKLSANETPLGPSPRAIRAFADSAAELHRYPDSSAAALRDAIAEARQLPAGRLVCGTGSDELIGLLVHAYAGPGDEILMSRHGFLMYKIYAQGYGVGVTQAPEKNLRTDVDAMLSKVNERTKLVFVANPNNPTGSHIAKDEMRRLHAGLPPHVLLVIDAAYSEYVSQPDYSAGHELVNANENVVVLHTFSKIYGLAALRLGWAHAPEHIAGVLGRIRGPFNVSIPAMNAGIEAIRDTAFTEQARQFNSRWREWLSKELAAMGLKVYPSIANFILVEFEKGRADAANKFLVARNLYVREVSGYGLPDCLRISIGLEEDNRAVVAGLKEFLKA